MKSKLALEVRRGKTLREAWLAIRRNSRTSKSEDTKKEIAAFEAKSDTNLKRISAELQKGIFVFPPARGIKVLKNRNDKSNFRPLVVAKVEARIVQRAIHDVLIAVPEIEKFVKTPYSFGGIKKKDAELSAVPAAIQAVLEAIGNGAGFMIKSDISGFFTRIPKSSVIDIVANAVNDTEFITLFKKAISVELENMTQLRGAAQAFPIQDIGVAQGNSLSPLLGNILLYDFDLDLNKDPDVRCIRYIDDFIILGPSQQVVENKYSRALHLLRKMGMSTSTTKTKKSRTNHVFSFLGIEFANGLLRPAVGSRTKMLDSINKAFSDSERAFERSRGSQDFERSMSLLHTLNRVSGIMKGWAMHYRFCNDGECLRNLDSTISERFGRYLATYRAERGKADDTMRWKLLGIEAIAQVERTPFLWPTNKGAKVVPMGFSFSGDAEPDDPPWN
jgi:retron-type reverse transcriptase